VVGIPRPVCRRDHERVLAGARERPDHDAVPGPNWNQHWDDWQAAVAKFHADFPGKDFSGLVYGPTSNHVYGRASLALADPNGIFVGNQGGTDVIQSSWATCPHPAVDPVAATATC
jgi:hypothetical protein